MKNGSLAWNPNLSDQAKLLSENLTSVSLEDLSSAVQAENHKRFQEFCAGIKAYTDAKRATPPRAQPVIWQDGTTRVLNYATGQTGLPLLIIPSLVNRSRILDLSEQNSFMRALAGQGFQPYLVDWGDLGPEERTFDISDYVTKRLEPALQFLSTQHPKQGFGVIGYCMGGLLALALAQRQQKLVSALALLATPWDFHCGKPAHLKMLTTMMPGLLTLIDNLGELPVDILQAMFTSLKPWMTIDKFRRFSHTLKTSDAYQSFIALEDWLNDGCSLSPCVAKECLQDWYIGNVTMQGKWCIDGTPVLPEGVTQPNLCIIPKSDHIVPPASALALANALPHNDCIMSNSGHVGMVVGRHAKSGLIDPLSSWFKSKVKNN